MDIKIEKRPFWLRYKYYLIGLLLLFVLLGYLAITAAGPSRLRQEFDQLQVSEVKEDRFLEYLDVEGLVQPKLTVKLNSFESGIVDRIVAEDGSLLKKGDTILVLANPELLRTIDDERDELEKQQITNREKQLQMEQKTSELKRNTMKTVYDLNRLSKQHELDKEEYAIGIKSKAQLEVSSDEYAYNQKNARFLLDELRQDSIKNRIEKELLLNDRIRGEKKYARSLDRLQSLVVRAPIDGQLSFLSVIPGEKVNAGTNIGELKEMEQMKLTASVSEYYIDRISLGLPASITYQDRRYNLKITRINPEIKERLFEVDLIFTDSLPDNIRIGKSYRIQIEMGQPEKALTIDKGNFYQATGGQWIFVINKAGNKAVRREITIGRQNPLQYEILKGLQPGEKAIISGYDYFGNAQELILK